MNPEGISTEPAEIDNDIRFALVPEWLLSASANAVKLYAILDRYANSRRKLWPSQELMAAKMGCSERTIRSIVAELRDLGALAQVQRRWNGSTIWELRRAQTVRQLLAGPTGKISPDGEATDCRLTRATEREPLNESHLLASDEPDAGQKQTRRAPDPVWDALMAACEITTITQSARGAYNKAVRNLKAVGAEPDEIYRRAQVFRTRWPDATLTPTALERRWGECDQVDPGPTPMRNGLAVNGRTPASVGDKTMAAMGQWLRMERAQ